MTAELVRFDVRWWSPATRWLDGTYPTTVRLSPSRDKTSVEEWSL